MSDDTQSTSGCSGAHNEIHLGQAVGAALNPLQCLNNKKTLPHGVAQAQQCFDRVRALSGLKLPVLSVAPGAVQY